MFAAYCDIDSQQEIVKQVQISTLIELQNVVELFNTETWMYEDSLLVQHLEVFFQSTQQTIHNKQSLQYLYSKFKEKLQGRENELDDAQYLLEHMERIFSPSYVPTMGDYIHVSLKTAKQECLAPTVHGFALKCVL